MTTSLWFLVLNGCIDSPPTTPSVPAGPARIDTAGYSVDESRHAASASRNRFVDVHRLRIPGEQTVPIATSEAVLDTLIKYANLRDELNFSRMVAAGQILLVANNTKCTISDPGFVTHEVRIDEGPHEGRYGFVPSEFVETISADEQARESAKAEAELKAYREQRAVQLAAEEEARFRTWTSANGKFNFDAKLSSMASDTATLTGRDGKIKKVTVDKLSEADREYIQKWKRNRR
jgi:hypothetical protein